MGPIKARSAGKVTLFNIDAPRSYTLTGEGHGGAAGFARSDIDVSLEAPEPAVTVLRYGVKANIGGKLAQLGSRTVDAAGRKAADVFFAQFGSVVAREPNTRRACDHCVDIHLAHRCASSPECFSARVQRCNGIMKPLPSHRAAIFYCAMRPVSNSRSSAPGAPLPRRLPGLHMTEPAYCLGQTRNLRTRCRRSDVKRATTSRIMLSYSPIPPCRCGSSRAWPMCRDSRLRRNGAGFRTPPSKPRIVDGHQMTTRNRRRGVVALAIWRVVAGVQNCLERLLGQRRLLVRRGQERLDRGVGAGVGLLGKW